MSDQQKALRKQLRNVVKDMLPELMSTEVLQALDKKYEARLSAMESKQRDLIMYLMRATMPPAVPPSGVTE